MRLSRCPLLCRRKDHPCPQSESWKWSGRSTPGRQIGAAVSWVTDLSAPLVQVREAWPASPPFRADCPDSSMAHVEIIRVRYWSGDAELRDEPDVTVAAADLGRMERLTSTLWEIWPPTGGWSEWQTRTTVRVDAIRQVYPLPQAIVQACVSILRQLYDGVQDIRPTATLRALLAPFHLYNTGGDGYGTDISSDDDYVDLTPAGTTPVTPTNYLALRAADAIFIPSDFTVSGTTDALAIPAGNGYVAYARPASAGDFTHVYVYPSGVANTQNQINAWEQLAHDLVIGGIVCRVIHSLTVQHGLPGLTIEVEAG